MLTIQDTILVTNPVSVDAFLCNYYVIGSNIQIDTIPEYLIRIPKQLRRRNVVLTFITTFGRIPISEFSDFQNNCTTELYIFKNGIEDSNLIPFVLQSHLPVTIAEDSKVFASINPITQTLTITIDWETLTDKPSTFPSSVHTHVISDIIGLVTALTNKLETSLKGSINGLAELDENGFVKNTQLPSYVDDVLDGTWISDTVFNDLNSIAYIPENGKIYLDTTYNKSYRWSGTIYARINDGIALGETNQTAYRGDRGKIAYDHTFLTNNPHNVTAAQLGLVIGVNILAYRTFGSAANSAITDFQPIENQRLSTTGSPSFQTVKITNLTDGYIPYHVNDNVGLADSYLKYNDVNSLFIEGIYSSTGGMIKLRDVYASGSNQTFMGIEFNSAHGSNWTIGKYSNNTQSLFQIRDQSGSITLSINESGNISFPTLSNTKSRLLYVSSSGQLMPIEDGTVNQVLQTNGNGVYSFVTIPSFNIAPQNLSGTTITYNASLGVHANITLSGNTTINMSNIQAGTVGNITIINDGTARQITFSGYTFIISHKIRASANTAWSSAIGYDKFTWDYDGTRVSITGEYNLQ